MITGPRDTIKRARMLRSEMSLPEVLLWKELRKRPGELKFRAQHPAGVYVVDFYCAAAKLAIEIDGAAHDSAPAAKRDASRSAFLRSQGVATLRVPAKAVFADIGSVVVRIVEVCGQRVRRRRENARVPLHHPADGPPPRFGEDLGD
ncbi:very-short-patch-repair endonuclease [Novosphingobium chloroacetimidivorans]|uniref:Very-short-patch-repair endonuclease n=1 Tax=Novosphingobium chloroacetimidivorans TaxID=1428314 RepID=A0A7W7NU99_9SPHN|nr:DUF559 domain-containing protein [Novosphingobium chloroacetimidivorans]MBB4857303.1 very-short-patch-repair endonuclease [Novosphingobium chloroacetimidivorans]